MNELIKYPKIYALGHEENAEIFADKNDDIQITEIMDGANLRFLISNNIIIFGSRTQQLTSDLGKDDNVSKQFRGAIDHIRRVLGKKDLRMYEGRIYFMENMVKHTMDYDWEKIPIVLGYDVYDIKDKKFLFNSQEIFEEMGFTHVPVLGIYSAEKMLQIKDFEQEIPISEYAPKGNPTQKAEGIVLKNHKTSIYAKIVQQTFREDNALAFGGTPKYAENDTGKICATYVTNSRIEKAVFYFVDQGEKLDMALMHMIVGYVYKDVWEENWKAITKKYSDVNFREMRRIIINRCRVVLSQIIVNNER